MKLNLDSGIGFPVPLEAGTWDAAAQKAMSRCQLFSPCTTNIKNALVSGDAGTASKQAAASACSAWGVDIKKMTTAEQSGFLAAKQKLTAGSKLIADTKDIARNGEAYFLSDMISPAREVKLRLQPIYLDYVSMKRSWWMSAEQAIKTPITAAARSPAAR